MPSIKNFEKKPSQKNQHSTKQRESSSSALSSVKIEKMEKRRPGRESHQEVEGEDSVVGVKVIDVEKIEKNKGEMMETQKAEKETTQAAETATETSLGGQKQTSKIEISFPGSELLRSRFPKPFDVAEAVATDWMNDGKFDQIPLEQPLAKSLAQQGLVKAKEIEKKVMASPTTEKIAMQAFTYAMKAQTLFNEIKTKVNKK